MCGIAGHLRFPRASEETVRAMIGAIKHRGPNGEGIWARGPIALGHRRLSIIDLATGAQPLGNEDGSVQVTFNGEIYNYRELIADLQTRHEFRTTSDTEVLVHLYEEKGERLVDDLRGMFAFAIWDERRQRLFAARDRFGEKPFLYVHRDGALHFASEMAALERAGVDLGGVDRDALSDYLELLYVPAPKTIWRNVQKLPAGHALIADANGVRTWRYWSPPVPGSLGPSARMDKAALRGALEEAVRLQLRSDVPIAALLSGGIDSSTVVGLMAQELGAGVKTFSVGFGRDDDELPYARMVAERHRTEHHELIITSDTLTQTLEAMRSYSEPFGDSSAVPSVAVCHEVAKHVKVVLTGDGGDELFAGYGTYRMLERIRRARLPHLLSRVTSPVDHGRVKGAARWLKVLAERGAGRQRAMVEVFRPEERAQLLHGHARVAPLGPSLPCDADVAIAFDLSTYLPDDLMLKMDTAAMHSSLESRSPLLDWKVAERAIPLPIAAKQNATEGKLVLKAAISDLVPEAVLRREKRGFGSPVGAWLRGPLKPLVGDWLGGDGARVKEWLEPKAVDRVIRAVLEGRGNPHQLWAVLALEGWGRRDGVVL